MLRSDFKVINDEMFEICEDFINGKTCHAIECEKCPFNFRNSKNGVECFDFGYSDTSVGVCSIDELVIKSAYNFLKFKEDEVEETIKVRITKGMGWAVDKVGEIIEVINHKEDMHYYYLASNGTYVISVDNCEVVEPTKTIHKLEELVGMKSGEHEIDDYKTAGTVNRIWILRADAEEDEFINLNFRNITTLMSELSKYGFDVRFEPLEKITTVKRLNEVLSQLEDVNVKIINGSLVVIDDNGSEIDISKNGYELEIE